MNSHDLPQLTAMDSRTGCRQATGFGLFRRPATAAGHQDRPRWQRAQRTRHRQVRGAAYRQRSIFALLLQPLSGPGRECLAVMGRQPELCPDDQ
jgi:hypothetical protein